MARHVVARADQIAPGSSMLVTLKGREIGVFNVKGEYYAFSNKCPHEGAPLCKGRIVNLVEAEEPGRYRVSRHGELLRCPWHGWEFDLRTGQSWCDPENTWVKSYNVSVEPGETVVKGPYVAETFAVSVEGDYVVVEV
jgi:nitrite reductase/ring-hydroxylating ferredoxin subunit